MLLTRWQVDDVHTILDHLDDLNVENDSVEIQTGTAIPLFNSDGAFVGDAVLDEDNGWSFSMAVSS